MSQENFFALFARQGEKRSRQLTIPPVPADMPEMRLVSHEPAVTKLNAPLTVVSSSNSSDDDEELLLRNAVKPRLQPAPSYEVPLKFSTQVLPVERQLATPTATSRANAADRQLEVLLTTLASDEQMFLSFQPFMTNKTQRLVSSRDSSQQLSLEPLRVPDGMSSACGDRSLRSYQLDGVRFLAENFRRGLNSILADDMGLGKTAQVCAFLSLLRRHGACGPHLIVAPLSTVGAWRRELASWAPLLRVHKYHGKDRGQLKDTKTGVFIVTPATLLQDRGFFRERVWQSIIVDEAHLLKDQATSISTVSSKIRSVARIAMTGTPVSNSPAEVWALMRYLYPKFGNHLDAPTADECWKEMTKECTAVLKYVMLRRNKNSLDLGLPRRIDLPPTLLEPTPFQAALYAHLLRSASDLRSREGLASVLVNLRRAYCHPTLYKLHSMKQKSLKDSDWSPDESCGIMRLRHAGVSLSEAELVLPSSKMVHVDGLLRDIYPSGERVLIFSTFTSQLDLLEGLCKLRGYSCDRLDGETLPVEREILMKRFNHPVCKVFVLLISTTAGGVGITLTGANHVIIYDAHFNPQMDRQAADRAHRLGQTRTVTVHRLCLKRTIEERVLERARLRAAASDTITDGADESGLMLTDGAIGRILEEEQRHVEIDPADEAMASAYLADALELQPPNFFGNRGAVIDAEDDDCPTANTVPCFACHRDVGAGPGSSLKCPQCCKRYHIDCDTWNTTTIKARWRCRRHDCSECGKQMTLSDEQFLCSGCTASSCFECVDADWTFDMTGSPDGVAFPRLSHVYENHRRDEYRARRSVYFTQCKRCAGRMDAGTSESDLSDSSDVDTVSSAASTLPPTSACCS